MRVRLDTDRMIEAQTVLGPLWVEEGSGVVTERLLSEGVWDLTIAGLMERVLRPGSTLSTPARTSGTSP